MPTLFFYRIPLLTLLVCLCIFIDSHAQNETDYTQLSYQQIDSLILLNYKKRDFKTNIKILQAAIVKSSAEFGGRDSMTAEILTNLGFFYSASGNKERALQLYIEAKDIIKEVLGTQHTLYATSIMNIAHIYRKSKDYEKALLFFTQAKDILHSNPNAKKTTYAKILFDIASLEIERKQYQKALPTLQAAFSIYEKALGVDDPKTTQVMISIGVVYLNLGELDKAIKINLLAKATSIKKLGKTHVDIARANLNLATIYNLKKNYERALKLCLEAKEIYAKTLGQEHSYYLIAINRIISTYLLQNNTTKAKKYIKEALQIASQTSISLNIKPQWLDSLTHANYLSNYHIKTTITTLNLLDDVLPIDQKPKEKQLVAELVHTLLTQFKNNLSSEKDKLETLSISNLWLRKSLTVIPSENITDAFALADKNKSNLLLEATQSSKKYSLGKLPDSISQKDITLIKQRNNIYARLQKEKEIDSKKALAAKFNEINLQIDHLHQQIAIKYPKYHALKYTDTAIRINDIKKEIAPNAALIEYVISDSILHIFCITKNSQIWKKVRINGQQLVQEANKLHETLSNYTLLGTQEKKSSLQYGSIAHSLYLKLIAPIKSHLNQINHLIIIPDRELSYIPFEVLLTEPSGQMTSPYKDLTYLINQYSFSYNYSAALWLDNNTASAKQNNGEIFGVAANYKSDSTLTTLRSFSEVRIREQLIPLPQAHQEVKVLENKFKGFYVYDDQASELNLKKHIHKYAVLHFALHGILNEKKPLLSSLALTEDGDSIENNFWQAYEISKTDLNADLVVLSACETGYGRFEIGNGVASLARSFMYAGTPSLVVSLWQVNDKATSVIMELFYQNLANGMDKSKALRHAKLEYIQRAEGLAGNPAFWSPFIQIGNSNTIPLAKKPSLGIIAWLGGIGSLLIVSFGSWRYLKRRNLEIA